MHAVATPGNRSVCSLTGCLEMQRQPTIFIVDIYVFRSVMSYNKFALINRFLHLNSSEAPARGEPGFDAWHKIRPLLNYVNSRFKLYFVPDQYISIDESMVGMKNRHIYIQYVANQRHCRFGIKKFELCDSKTGYVCHVELYSGRDFEIGGDDGQGSAVVMHLLQECDLLDKGYHLLTHDFYTQVTLAQNLSSHSTMLTGTVRSNSKQFPTDQFPARMAVQTSSYLQSGQLLACAYRDKKSQKKPVMLLTTGCAATDFKYQKRGEDKLKPACVLRYNKSMGGVDLSDRKLYQVAAERPCNRYWVKIFRNLVDICLRNSYELYLNAYPNTNLSCADYVAEIVESLCGTVDRNPQMPVVAKTHRLKALPGRQERDCVVCSDRKNGIRRRSRTWCAGCAVGVHKKCFERLDHIADSESD